MIEAALEIHWQRVRRHSPRDWARESALECVHSPVLSLVVGPEVSVRGRGECQGHLRAGHTLIRPRGRGPEAAEARRRKRPPPLSVFCHRVSHAGPCTAAAPQDPSPGAPRRRAWCSGPRNGSTLAEPAAPVSWLGGQPGPTASGTPHGRPQPPPPRRARPTTGHLLSQPRSRARTRSASREHRVL